MPARTAGTHVPKLVGTNTEDTAPPAPTVDDRAALVERGLSLPACCWGSGATDTSSTYGEDFLRGRRTVSIHRLHVCWRQLKRRARPGRSRRLLAMRRPASARGFAVRSPAAVPVERPGRRIIVGGRWGAGGVCRVGTALRIGRPWALPMASLRRLLALLVLGGVRRPARFRRIRRLHGVGRLQLRGRRFCLVGRLRRRGGRGVLRLRCRLRRSARRRDQRGRRCGLHRGGEPGLGGSRLRRWSGLQGGAHEPQAPRQSRSDDQEIGTYRHAVWGGGHGAQTRAAAFWFLHDAQSSFLP